VQVCRDYLLPTGYCLEPEWVVASIINSNEGNELWKISAFVLHLGYVGTVHATYFQICMWFILALMLRIIIVFQTHFASWHYN